MRPVYSRISRLTYSPVSFLSVPLAVILVLIVDGSGKAISVKIIFFPLPHPLPPEGINGKEEKIRCFVLREREKRSTAVRPSLSPRGRRRRGGGGETIDAFSSSPSCLTKEEEVGWSYMRGKDETPLFPLPGGGRVGKLLLFHHMSGRKVGTGASLFCLRGRTRNYGIEALGGGVLFFLGGGEVNGPGAQKSDPV